MFRASLVLSFFLLPALVFGQATIPIDSSAMAHSQAAPQGGQPAPSNAPTAGGIQGPAPSAT